MTTGEITDEPNEIMDVAWRYSFCVENSLFRNDWAKSGEVKQTCSYLHVKIYRKVHIL